MNRDTNKESPITHLDIALTLEARRMAKAVTDVIFSEFKLTGYECLKQYTIALLCRDLEGQGGQMIYTVFLYNVKTKIDQVWESLANPMRLSIQIGDGAPMSIDDDGFGVSVSIRFSIENHDSDQQYLHVEIQFKLKGNALEIDTHERYLNPEVAIHLAR